MKRIPNIVLNENQVKTIMTRGRIVSGGEAVICRGNNPYTLYKIFNSVGKAIPMSNNKEKKVIRLYEREIEHSVKPVSTISLNGILIGYEMVDEYDFDSYKLYQLDKEELMHFLKETKNILEYFSSKGIIYGDMEPRNILFNRGTGEVKFCDMDNIQIDELEMDIFPYSLIEYNETRGIDDGVHPYMHNKLVLGAFDLDLYCSTNFALKKVFKRPGRKIIESMRNPLDFKGEYAIEYIKKYK